MENAATVLHMGPTGLGMTRSLGRLGIEVFGVDWNRRAVGFSSKFCKKRLVLANPVTNPDGCVDALVDLGARLDHPAVLLPAADEYVTLVSSFSDVLSRHFSFNVPEPSVVRNIVDKRRQYDAAGRLGIPIPKTFSAGALEEVLSRRDSFTYPVVVKGSRSCEWRSAFKAKAFVANDFDELTDYCALAASRRVGVVLQEMIPGPNRNHFKVCAYYSRERRLLAAFCAQKIRQFPLDFGVGTLMTTVDMPDLIVLGRKFFEGIGYTGMGSIEFKRDEKDGEFKLIELNPRFWEQNIQATRAGINFSYINYLDCLGREVEANSTFEENVRWLDLFRDFGAFLAARRRGETSLSQWVESIRHVACHAHLARDDPKPAWSRLSQLGRSLLLRPFRS